MTCHEFRRRHLDFLDGSLGPDLFGELSRHHRECEPCARLHVALRRGLLVARNLPRLRPSPSFARRLRERLELTAWSPPRSAHRAQEARIRLA